MAIGFRQSSRRQTPSSSRSSNNGNNGDAANFECNICLDLAQDPIVTLCGHLFCWPCLYKWLGTDSSSKECPVCKALIEEDKLVPLYGRGKNSTDLRSKSIYGVDIPHRPTGQRPETSPPLEPNHHIHQNRFVFVGTPGGFSPMPPARLGNFTLPAAVAGTFPSASNVQLHGFPDPNLLYGPAAAFPYGYPYTFHGGGPPGFPRPVSRRNRYDDLLKLLLLVIGLSLVLAQVYNGV